MRSPLPPGEGWDEGGPERVPRVDMPHPSLLPEGEGDSPGRLCRSRGRSTEERPLHSGNTLTRTRR